MKLLSLLSALLLTFPNLHPAQTSTTAPQRDSQALTILNQALSTSGGSTAVASIKDFTATGSITYHWAGSQVQGTATVRALATTSFTTATASESPRSPEPIAIAPVVPLENSTGASSPATPLPKPTAPVASATPLTLNTSSSLAVA